MNTRELKKIVEHHARGIAVNFYADAIINSVNQQVGIITAQRYTQRRSLLIRKATADIAYIAYNAVQFALKSK
jgi:hypothetical protein